MAAKVRRKKSVSNMTNKRRLLFFFICVCAMFAVMAARIGYIQIVKHDAYAAMALSQQTDDEVITAKRGTIYDSNMKALAINQSMYTVWVRPSEVAAAEADSPGYTANMAKVLAGIFTEKTEEDFYKILTSESTVLKIEKYATEEQTEAVRNAISEDGGKVLTGIQIGDTVKRYYPMGAFASHVIGSTNDDNNGMSGLELYYDQYLNGRAGRWIKSADPKGRNLTTGVEKYYAAEDGYSIVLTIDEVIQHYVEKAIEQAYADTSADSVMAIAMNPKNGEILAMASYPDYDLNDPRTPLIESEKEYMETLTDEEKVEFWNEMWRNPLVNDTYEPGSPFKLLTTAMALEEGLTSVSDTFVCKPVQIYDALLKCWHSPASHGTETLAQGVANSCNPVFIALSQRLGVTRFYKYLTAYGFFSGTGIDYPGEAQSIVQSSDTVGPVGLATSSYGQGIACTAVQLITALSAAGNEGKMMRPHLVKEMVDSDGKVVETIEPEIVRQVISPQTASEICSMMEGVVRDGTGSAAYLPGYRVGGKTGTAQKAVNGRYTDYTMSSFFSMVPMDDPQFALLVVVDSPKGVHYGSQTAGPAVRSILTNTVKYLNIEPVFTADEQASLGSNTVTVPDLTGYSYYKAADVLNRIGLSYIACPDDGTDFIVADQYPKGGEQLAGGNSVCLYR